MRFLLVAMLLVGPSLYADHWPQWRGPSNNGIAKGDAPLTWSDTKNIAWKVTIPGRGHSTPVVWGDRMFLTTAMPTGAAAAPPPLAPAPAGGGGRGRAGGPGGGTAKGQEHKFVTMCIDRRTGKTLWERTAKSAVPHEGYHRAYGSFASNSPVTDGKLVYAWFGSNGVFAYDLNGKPVWSKDLPPMKMRLEFGEGATPVLAGDRLILVSDAQTGSYMVVLNKTTGKELWRQPRDEESSWSQPLVVRHNGKDQVIVAATKRVRSYDLETGKLIWECGGLGSNVIPTPLYRNGIVYVMSGHRDPNLMAIKLGREGDLTGTDSILWTNQRGNSYTPSPVLDGNKLYMLTDNGQISCLDVDTGKPYFLQQRLPKPYNFKASPVAAGGKLYLASEDGDVIVLKLGESYEVLATNNLADQMFIASPIVIEGTMYLRGQNTLFAIRESASK